MQMADVGGVPQEYGIGPEAVAAGTAGLLEIRLRALGHPHVDDKTDVWLVNAHAECIGTDHDADISLLPGGLPFGAGAGVQAGMVVLRTVAGSLEEGSGLLAFATVTHVHNTRSGNTGAHTRELPELIVGTADYIAEIGAFKAALEEGKAVRDGLA